PRAATCRRRSSRRTASSRRPGSRGCASSCPRPAIASSPGCDRSRSSASSRSRPSSTSSRRSVKGRRPDLARTSSHTLRFLQFRPNCILLKQDADILAEFLIESHENLEQMERELLVLESEPGSTATIASIFRTIRTIKGTCGFLGFGRLEAVGHAGESLLWVLRDEELEYSSGMANGLLAMVDVIKEHLGAMRRGGKEHPGDNSAVIARLGRLAKGLPDDGPPRAATPAGPPGPPANPRPATPGAVPGPPPAAPPPPPPAATAAETSIRVDVALLDRLMNLVGELVLARNQILQFAASQSAATFLATVQRLNLITTDLQEGVMKTRMQPIGNVF